MNNPEVCTLPHDLEVIYYHNGTVRLQVPNDVYDQESTGVIYLDKEQWEILAAHIFFGKGGERIRLRYTPRKTLYNHILMMFLP